MILAAATATAGKYRNLDPLDVSLWGRQAAFERDLLNALRALPQAGEVTLSEHIHDSVMNRPTLSRTDIEREVWRAYHRTAYQPLVVRHLQAEPSMTTEMRICRRCHFPFEGPSKRLAACCKCGTSERAWSIAASNASQDDLVGAIPHTHSDSRTPLRTR